MVRPCVARGFIDPADAVLHQCIRPLIGACAPGHHGYQRAMRSDYRTGLTCAGKTDPLPVIQRAAPYRQAVSPGGSCNRKRTRGSAMDVGGWLRRLGLEQYEAAFRENRIDDTVLPRLTAEDLKELGVGFVGDRRKLLDAIAVLRAEATAPTPSNRQSLQRYRRAPPGHRDVLRPCRLDGPFRAHGP
jgi:hypothetical protein